MKKHIKHALSILLLLFAWSTSHAQDQIIGIKTGAVGGGLWGSGNVDPNWTVCPPGWDHTQPGFFAPVKVADPVPINTVPTPYPGHMSGVGFLAPSLAPWQSMMYPVDNSMQGDWYYKTKLAIKPCQMEYAELYVEHAGADNYISEIFINGHPHAFPYTTGTPFDVHSGITIFIPGSELISGVQNELQIHVVNQGSNPTPTGLEFHAKLNIYAYAVTDASFNMSFAQYSNTLQLSTSYGYADHSWEVFSSNTGALGSYNFVGTFDDDEITIGSGADAPPCYYVKHTIETYCGTACEAYSACKFGCDYIPHDEHFCDLPAPKNLRYDATTHKVSWDPVPGAWKYTVFVYPGDPECCGDATTGARWRNYTTDVPVPEFVLTSGFHCFSFKVRAICEDGSEGPYSGKYCSNDMVHIGTPANNAGKGSLKNQTERATVNMYPNPAKGTVSIDIDMQAEGAFSLTIMDINGKLVKSVSGKTSGKKSSTTLSTEGMSKGVYIVEVSMPNGQSISKKLVVE